LSELSYCLHNSQNRHFVGIPQAFSGVFRLFLTSSGLYCRFESQGRQYKLATYPPNEVLSHVPSRWSIMTMTRYTLDIFAYECLHTPRRRCLAGVAGSLSRPRDVPGRRG
jgi:hypothetical protein